MAAADLSVGRGCAQRWPWKNSFSCAPGLTDKSTSVWRPEIGTLLRIRSQMMRAQCPACGETHEWAVRDAWLVRAA